MVMQFKITLNQSAPKVWRRIAVPADYTFFALHCAIQDAMGWNDSHLHEFRFTDKNSRRRDIRIGTPMTEDDYGDELIDERNTFLANHFGTRTLQCVYHYDFGDGWEHKILLEKTSPSVHGETYPKCIAGAQACPPDDCGGLGGYDHLRKVLKNKNHKEYRDMLEWLGLEHATEFDFTHFDPEEVIFNDPDEVLKEWNEGFGSVPPLLPMMSLQTEEDSLFEQDSFIGSPAGGRGNKLRYFTILSWEKSGKLSVVRKNCLKETLEKLDPKDAEVEDVEYENGFVLLTILVSMETAPGDVIDDIIISANGIKPFLRFHYYMTNVAKPNKQVIGEYLKEL
jgi:Plasmid pRiA4b ORF-3-like protein